MKKVNKTYKVIIDTNIWISFLIGKHLSGLHKYIYDQKIEIILCKEQLLELIEILNKPKIKKYIPANKTQEFINLLDEATQLVEIKNHIKICRDPKDDYLLSLSVTSNADYLVTGDVDLLSIKQIENTLIISFTDFEKKMLTF